MLDPADINILAQVCDLDRLMFSELTVTNILKSSGWETETGELPWKQNFYSQSCVSCRTISLLSFNCHERISLYGFRQKHDTHSENSFVSCTDMMIDN